MGSRWKVRVDSRVCVWGMPWLCDDAHFCIQTTCLKGLEEMRVHELVMDDSRLWDVPLLEAILECSSFTHHITPAWGFG